ncbi:MAG: Na/Pi cotransporter family protein [Sphingobacteriales bacterium]|nr:Na/Pi cotransporter family protein [Sphingobacteriales bacterium]
MQLIRLTAGIGLFLFAMHLIEESLKNLSGRNFKLFLQRMTQNRLGAVAGGAIVTGVLQSSSMVSLMVLAFVGAGVFTMKNAMAIILGANLGTTLDSWLVATLGFKVNIDNAAYPAVGIGGLLLILFANRKSVKYTAYFLLGFGLLFIGLSFMKTAMEAEVQQFDFSKYAQLPLLVFLLLGFLITMLVQSSSVTMALTLSALYAGAVTFPAAAALVLGSETGTTIKIMLGAIGGNASKKRVALGNFLFNIWLTFGSFIFLSSILRFIKVILEIADPMIGLVTFQTMINLVSIVVFLPFLNPFARFLERFFKDTDASAAAYIGNANVAEPQTALDLFGKETEYFIHNCMLFNLGQFETDTDVMEAHPEFNRINENRKFLYKSQEEKYDFLKQLQGELQSFYLDLRIKTDDEQEGELNQLIAAVRSSMYAVKGIKDISTNITNLRHSSKDIKYDFFMNHKKETKELYDQFHAFMMRKKTASFESLKEVLDSIEYNYSYALNDFYKDAQNAPVEDLDMTIVINFNRELFTSNKAMLMAVKDFLLNEKDAESFNEIPVYRT